MASPLHLDGENRIKYYVVVTQVSLYKLSILWKKGYFPSLICQTLATFVQFSRSRK